MSPSTPARGLGLEAPPDRLVEGGFEASGRDARVATAPRRAALPIRRLAREAYAREIDLPVGCIADEIARILQLVLEVLLVREEEGGFPCGRKRV
jgi:hypothetical protein